MTDELDKLRPEVRCALGDLSYISQANHTGQQQVDTLRSELLRLTQENAALASWQCPFLDGSGLTGDDHGHQYCRKSERLGKAEAELAALKARIAGSTRAYHSSFEYTLDASTLYARATGIPGEETYALVKVED